MPLEGCRVHISQHCRIINWQCTACAAAGEAKAHAMEQSVPETAPAHVPLPVMEQSVSAPAPAPYRREDSHRGKNSRTLSTRSRSRSRDRNLEDSDN